MICYHGSNLQYLEIDVTPEKMTMTVSVLTVNTGVTAAVTAATVVPDVTTAPEFAVYYDAHCYSFVYYCCC